MRRGRTGHMLGLQQGSAREAAAPHTQPLCHLPFCCQVKKKDESAAGEEEERTVSIIASLLNNCAKQVGTAACCHQPAWHPAVAAAAPPRAPPLCPLCLRVLGAAWRPLPALTGVHRRAARVCCTLTPWLDRCAVAA